MSRRGASSSAPTPAATRALRDFLATEIAGGVLLVGSAVAALVWVNSPWQASYERLWGTELGGRLGGLDLELDLRHWVNDGLMAIFFLVVGLEVKRELLLGELRARRQAALPVIAAIGGMAVPALIYLLCNPSGPEREGWGTPMATDIAFALGVLALIARSIPSAVRLFLLTLAIVDDIGAIVVIAVVYTSSLDVTWLGGAGAVVAVIAVLRRVGVTATPLFAVLGLCLWVLVHESGVHATIAGVVMGLMAPAEPTPRRSVSQLERLEHALHPWSSLAIVPLFALANAGIVLTGDGLRDAATSSVTIGVVVGLVLGKAVGISAASWLAVRRGWADLPSGVTWRQLVGAAALGGIGFTVSLFIAGLAFEDPVLVDNAKIGVLAASLVATVPAFVLLRPSRARRG